jgi:hypothetical protein
VYFCDDGDELCAGHISMWIVGRKELGVLCFCPVVTFSARKATFISYSLSVFSLPLDGGFLEKKTAL